MENTQGKFYEFVDSQGEIFVAIVALLLLILILGLATFILNRMNISKP